MKNPTETWNNLRRHCRREWKLAFFSTFLLGLLIHMPIMLRDIPNHDGLASMYFDQNMITSGRWFLTVACGISSYYTLPWLIGLLAMLYLGIAAVLLVEFLEVRQGWAAVLVGGLLAVFPLWHPLLPMYSPWTAICWRCCWRCWRCFSRKIPPGLSARGAVPGLQSGHLPVLFAFCGTALPVRPVYDRRVGEHPSG